MEKSARTAPGDERRLRSLVGTTLPFPERFRAGEGNGLAPACEPAP
jgi:hypothetical protein